MPTHRDGTVNRVAGDEVQEEERGSKRTKWPCSRGHSGFGHCEGGSECSSSSSSSVVADTDSACGSIRSAVIVIIDIVVIMWCRYRCGIWGISTEEAVEEVSIGSADPLTRWS